MKVISFGQLAVVRNSIYCLHYQGSCRGKMGNLRVPLSSEASWAAGHTLQHVQAGEKPPARWEVIHWAGVALSATLGWVKGRAEVSSLSKPLCSLGKKKREKLHTERRMCVTFHLKLETQGGIFLTHRWFWVKKSQMQPLDLRKYKNLSTSARPPLINNVPKGRSPLAQAGPLIWPCASL